MTEAQQGKESCLKPFAGVTFLIGLLFFFFRGAEILYSLAVANARHAGMEGRYPLTDYALLVDARRSVGLFQHHDAITGTAKENVVIDYGTK